MRPTLTAGVLLFVAFAGCSENPEYTKEQIASLTSERDELKGDVAALDRVRSSLRGEVSGLRAEKAELDAIVTGHAVYVLTVKYQQTDFGLDFEQHMKNAMNAFEFEVPVSKEFYEACEVGKPLAKNFKVGSMIVRGGFAETNLTVTKKHVKDAR